MQSLQLRLKCQSSCAYLSSRSIVTAAPPPPLSVTRHSIKARSCTIRLRPYHPCKWRSRHRMQVLLTTLPDVDWLALETQPKRLVLKTTIRSLTVSETWWVRESRAQGHSALRKPKGHSSSPRQRSNGSTTLQLLLTRTRSEGKIWRRREPCSPELWIWNKRMINRCSILISMARSTKSCLILQWHQSRTNMAATGALWEELKLTRRQ